MNSTDLEVYCAELRISQAAPHEREDPCVLTAVAKHVARSFLPREIAVGFQDIDRLRGLTFASLRHLPAADQKHTAAAVLIAQLRAGTPERAKDFADLVKERGLNRSLTTTGVPSEAFLALEGALTESYLANGDPTQAATHAERMLLSIPPQESRGWHLHALGLSAAASALNGNHTQALSTLADITRLRSEETQPGSEVGYFEAYAGLILACSSLESARLLELHSALDALVQRDAHARPLLELTEALTSAAQGNYRHALTVAQTLARGHGPLAPHIATRGIALALTALLLIQRGSAAHALATVRNLGSPNTHLICVPTITATAHIQMGDYRAALAATDACTRSLFTHSPLLLPAALIRRAIAKMRLGYREAAAATGLDALSLFKEVHPALSLALLPIRDVLELCALLEHSDPQVAPLVRKLRHTLRRLPPHRPPAVPIPPLSNREIDIALRIRSEQSYPQIAAQLYLSASTVKTQSHAIARKLGVRTRAEAVAQLECAGFYVLHSLEERST